MKQLYYVSILAAMALTASSVFAKNIDLHLEPKADSKVAGMVNTEAGVTIVYTPKNSEWIKVANPANGDVGWVKSADLGAGGYNMRVETVNSDGAHRYSISQIRADSQQQIDKAMEQFEQQQKVMLQHMQKMMVNMYSGFYHPEHIFVPVVIVPDQQKKHVVESAKTSKASH